MKIKILITSFFCLLAVVALFSCKYRSERNDKAWSELPEITQLDSLKETDFALTLESPLLPGKNIIYAPAFLFAWGEMRNLLGSSILVDSSNTADFKLLNMSQSHLRALEDSEYNVEVDTSVGLSVRAFFNKTLPFEMKLQVAQTPLIFEKVKVAAFGMYNYDEGMASMAHILYYKDDENFILKLLPKDTANEIILVKGVNRFQSLSNALVQIFEQIEIGRTEVGNQNDSWKYSIKGDDIFSIPSIKFNIGTNYRTLEGQKFFTSNKTSHSIAFAYQRTGLILNENGAVVESEAVMIVDSASAPVVKPHPKRMIFDKPFFVILKKKDQRNPYFVMRVANAELLTKE